MNCGVRRERTRGREREKGASKIRCGVLAEHGDIFAQHRNQPISRHPKLGHSASNRAERRRGEGRKQKLLWRQIFQTHTTSPVSRGLRNKPKPDRVCMTALPRSNPTRACLYLSRVMEGGTRRRRAFLRQSRSEDAGPHATWHREAS